jgi:hypothetical protein
MPVFDFLKMEVFYSKVFLVKCSRELDKVGGLKSIEGSINEKITLN